MHLIPEDLPEPIFRADVMGKQPSPSVPRKAAPSKAVGTRPEKLFHNELWRQKHMMAQASVRNAW